MADTLHKIPVLILGSYITALGTIRSLAAVGIEARCITPQDSYVRCSRWYRSPNSSVGVVTLTDDLPEYLERLAFDRAILMPCSDVWVSAVTELDNTLQSRFPSSQPDREVLELFLDKGKLEDVLNRLDIPRPRTFLLENESDLAAIGEEQSSNYFLKPRNSPLFVRRFGVKAFKIDSTADAARQYAQCRQAGIDVMLQEYIRGPADRHYFVDGFFDRHGEIRALFARQRIRMYPLDFGDSSYFTTVPTQNVDSAVKSLEKLLPEIKYRGIFSAEFKLDERDDTFKLIEVNTRPWTYIGFDTAHGMNMAEMAYRDALEENVSTVTDYDIGASMVYMPNDLMACLSLIRRGELSFSAWLRSWLRARSTIFLWDDPLPAVAWWWRTIAGKFMSLFARKRSHR